MREVWRCFEKNQVQQGQGGRTACADPAARHGKGAADAWRGMDASAIALAAGKAQGSHSPLIFCIKRFDVRARQTYNYSCSCRKNNVSGNGAFFLLAIVLFFSKMPLHFFAHGAVPAAFFLRAAMFFFA